MFQLSILGCGWLGEAFVAKYAGVYAIKAAVQSASHLQQLQPLNCQPYQLPQDGSDFYNADAVLISLSPRHNYQDAFELLVRNVSKDTQLILLSATSVYAGCEGSISDLDLPRLKEGSMLAMERFLLEKRSDTLVLRLGGLMGDDRVAGRWKQQRKVVENSCVNYLHQEDAISVINLCIEKNITNKILNVVAPQHPKRSEIYAMNEAKEDRGKTNFIDAPTRLIQSSYLIQNLGYTFIKPNPLEFWTKKVYNRS